MDLEHPSHINLLIKKATLVNFSMVGSALGAGRRIRMSLPPPHNVGRPSKN
jgi:hypothetical protein